MTTKPLVTVVMAVYNGEKYLRQSIVSILNQTFQNFEFIIINDGSSDKTALILSHYKDDRIQIIHNTHNIGLTNSLNKGLKQAKGTYIARLDADDLSSPTRLQKEIAFLQSHKEAGLVGSWYEAIDNKNKLLFESRPSTDPMSLKRTLYRKGNIYAHGSVMFRKVCLDNVGAYRPQFKYAQDLDLWLRIAEYYDIAMIPEVLYQWRIDHTSESLGKLYVQKQYADRALQISKANNKTNSEKLQSSDSNDEILDTAIYKSYSFYRWGKNFISYGSYAQALYLFKRAIVKYPMNFKAWLLFGLTLGLCIFPTSFTSFLKEIFRIYILPRKAAV